MATKLNTLLESPGVLIQEREVGTPTVNAVGTNIFFAGFTPTGPTDEPTNISSIAEFEEIFGLPTTPAEKYSYNAAAQILNTSNANLTFTRMPYGSGAGYGFSENYNALVFPIVGLSAVEKSPCSFFQSLPLSTIQSEYPWLVDQYIDELVCYGSANIDCPLTTSSNEEPGYVYIHDHPFGYDSILKEFRFVVDDDSDPEDLTLFQLRPTVSGSNTIYSVVNRFDLSAINVDKDEDQSGLNTDETRLSVSFDGSVYGVNYTITNGILSGQTYNGVLVSAGDVFATYSEAGAPVLKYFNATSNVAGTYNTGITNIFALTSASTYGLVSSTTISSNEAGFAAASGYYFGASSFCTTSNPAYVLQCSAVSSILNTTVGVTAWSFSLSAQYNQGWSGGTFSVVTSAKNATTQDTLITFCTIPVEAGLTCSTIEALGLEIPEDQKYDFYPIAGDAQLNDANFYAIGEPISKSINATEYQLLQNGQFNWKCGAYANAEAALDVTNNDVRAGIVVVNKLKTAQLEDFTGYYLALNDNLNVNPATNFDDLTAVAGYYDELCPGVSGSWVDVPEERWNFKVSETFDGTAGSITEIVHQNAGLDFGTTKYNDSLIVSLFKLRPSRLTETINKLDQTRVEQFVGSLNSERKVHDDFGGPDRSFFIENTVNNSSRYLEVLVNPYLSQNNCWNDQIGVPQKTVRMFREKTGGVFSNFDGEQTLAAYADKLYGSGSYIGYCRDALYDLCVKKDIGNLPAKLERALRNVENPVEYPIDITIDNGLSTIWATRNAVATDSCITNPSICYNYDDTYFVNTDSLSPYDGTVMNSTLQDSWESIFNIFDSFARYTRKAAGGTPHVHLHDPLRQIFVNGKDYKVVQRQKQLVIDPTTGQPTEKYATFGRNIYSYLRNLYQGLSTSFSISYPNWIKSYDVTGDKFMWFGPSAFEAALYARNDAAQYPWTSPFGTSNGQLANVVDIAINPNQRERDLLSRLSLNPIVKFPEGYLNWNSLTLLNESSAFKEISIRRGMLWLAKTLQANLTEFMGQPNNVVTRTRLVNKLRPILQFMKDNGGLYDYQIICNDVNNGAETIDQGVLNVAVYVKPTRTTKKVLVDLAVTGTGVDFTELL